MIKVNARRTDSDFDNCVLVENERSNHLSYRRILKRLLQTTFINVVEKEYFTNYDHFLLLPQLVLLC